MAADLNRAAREGVTQEQLNELVAKQAIVRGLPRAYVFNLDKQIVARGEFSYLFHFFPPTDEQLASARQGEVVLIEDPAHNEIRALVFLGDFFELVPLHLEQRSGRRAAPAGRDARHHAVLRAAGARARQRAAGLRRPLPGLRAAGDPGRDHDGAALCRAAGKAGRSPGRGGRAGRRRRPGRACRRGARRRRDRHAGPRLQPHDRPAQGPARRSGQRPRRDRGAPQVHRGGAERRHGGRHRPGRRGPGRADERGRRRDAGARFDGDHGRAAGPDRARDGGALRRRPHLARRRRARRGAPGRARRGARVPGPRRAEDVREPVRGFRADLRRHDGAGQRPAHGRLGRRRAAHRARDQEPADADPAFRRPAAPQVPRPAGRRR